MSSPRELRDREKYLDGLQLRRGNSKGHTRLDWCLSSPSSASSVSCASSSSLSSRQEDDDDEDEESGCSTSGDESDFNEFADEDADKENRTTTGSVRTQFRKVNSLANLKKATTALATVAAATKPAVLEVTPDEILHLECLGTSQALAHPSAHASMVDSILEHVIWIRTQAQPHLRLSPHLPRRVLIHCADGYTDSSILALAYLMYDRVCTLPEAYLCLQNEKKRSFFVYPGDLALLGAIEKKIMQVARAQGRSGMADSRLAAIAVTNSSSSCSSPRTLLSRPQLFSRSSSAGSSVTLGSLRTPAPSMILSAIARTASPIAVSSSSSSSPSPPPSLAVAHPWFYDERFDGSFPSRILDHIYLGNLSHASNALMLKELGITHVLSVGESALVPPHKHVVASSRSSGSATANAAKARTPTNSLWLEQSLGNITVLDIPDIQDDGVDSILCHLLTAIEFIDAARAHNTSRAEGGGGGAGGKVLVHCRVGVSRSATLVVAYVMKHLDRSLADAYLLVRARRLNILIQPTILFMWTLHMYEEEIRESAYAVVDSAEGGEGQGQGQGDGQEGGGVVAKERAGRLAWPVLATEIADLNAKCASLELACRRFMADEEIL